MEWFFDGLGIELIIVFISLFLSGIASGLILYKVNIDKKIRLLYNEVVIYRVPNLNIGN